LEAFVAIIPFYKPTLRRKDMDAVLQTMVDERIGPGERKNLFLKEFCERVGFTEGVALRTIVDALTFSLKILDLPAGSAIGASVLAPSFYSDVVRSSGYELMLGDIDKEHGCLSSKEAERLVQEGCKALLLHEPVCQIPFGVEYKELGVPVIEDISQSIGSSFEGRNAGSWGDLAICSFEEDGVVSCGGGAALVFNDREHKTAVSELLLNMRRYVELPDMNAALGLIQLAAFDEHLHRRRELYSLYSKSLMKTHHRLFGIGHIDFEPNGYGFCTTLDSKAEDVIAFAKKYEVSAKRTFVDSLAQDHQEEFETYPVALPAFHRSISLPIYPFLSQSDLQVVLKVVAHLP
ncbi:MAG TPA: DegT/DnrJ/EryC1/StrS family aminotransferase, partial [Sphaerochaeta sp.]|nr:DegT/DnrJ/EryC1/StrS family aminotransferase [Sphaerochaeta sp.]HQB54727.1 DegT/DnrJ/EryC1/StrS family aminotransferase [Sphaerochaeta sp.]